MFERYSDADIAALDKYTKPVFDPDAPALQVRGRQFQGKLAAFLKAEGALAMVKLSYRDGKLVHGEGYDFQPGQTLAVPAIELAQEDYRRLVRLAKTGPAPEIEISVAARYDSSDLMADNIIAVAREHGVPLHEDPNLAATLNALDLETEIPPELYRAVAEVLIFIYRLNGRLNGP